MLRALAVSIGVLVAVTVSAQPSHKAHAMDAARAARSESHRKLSLANKPFTGDFDAMLERRMIRVAAPYSRSLFYIDKGRERGIGAELVRDLERWLNQKYAKQLGKRPLTLYLVAVTRDKLLPDLTSGPPTSRSATSP